jgi:uncharacterized protein YqeY
MSIEQSLTDKLKEAMRKKDEKVVSVIRMVKSEATKTKTASGFDGNIDDKFWTTVIERYVKQQKKALLEYEKLGEKGKEGADSLKFEIDFLSPFLPEMLSREEVEKLVDSVLAKTEATNLKMVGKIMGAIMKDNKGKVDAAMVKQVITEKLG